MTTAGNTGGPWGGNDSNPPDISDLARQAQNKFNEMLPGGRPGSIFILIALVLAAGAARTVYYTVPSDSVAVVQRFGKYLKDVPPGLHKLGQVDNHLGERRQVCAKRIK